MRRPSRADIRDTLLRHGMEVGVMARVGADEAGKGPVLGAMYVAAVRVPHVGILPEDLADSKDLTDRKRADLAARIRTEDDVQAAVASVPVADIDRPDTDMIGLTAAGQARALGAVAEAGDTGRVDAGDVDADRFGRRVADACSVAVTIEAAHGADGRYPEVSAASILAKEARERHVQALSKAFGEVGSGYPSDPTTRRFLREYVEVTGKLPPCARRSWQTSADVLAAADQSSLDAF